MRLYGLDSDQWPRKPNAKTGKAHKLAKLIKPKAHGGDGVAIAPYPPQRTEIRALRAGVGGSRAGDPFNQSVGTDSGSISGKSKEGPISVHKPTRTNRANSANKANCKVARKRAKAVQDQVK